MFRKLSNKTRLDAILASQRNTNARLERIEERLNNIEENIDAISRRVTGFEHRMRRSVRFAADLDAGEDSAKFMLASLGGAQPHNSGPETLRASVTAAPEGMLLEFGVASGRTLRMITAAKPGTRIVGFDSFKGLPEDWRGEFKRGHFMQSSIPHVEGAELQIGLFQETLEPFLSSNSDPIGFIHLDADLYSSTKYVLDQCGPRLAPGAILLFDEYFNYPNWREHEYRAFMEWAAANHVEWEYTDYCYMGEQVAVRIKSC